MGVTPHSEIIVGDKPPCIFEPPSWSNTNSSSRRHTIPWPLLYFPGLCLFDRLCARPLGLAEHPRLGGGGRTRGGAAIPAARGQAAEAVQVSNCKRIGTNLVYKNPYMHHLFLGRVCLAKNIALYI